MKLNRRNFLKLTAMAMIGAALPGTASARTIAPTVPARQSLLTAIAGGTLNPADVPQFVTPLVIPPAMPRTAMLNTGMGKNTHYYEIAVRQFAQQILPAGLPPTDVWSYGSANHPGTFNYPAFTIEAKWNQPVRVKWMNELVDAAGNFLPHLLPVDQTLHWANPPGGIDGRDMRPMMPTAEPYTGPVPFVTHVHGAHTAQESDGYPEAWYLPAANDIPDGYATTGTYYDKFQLTAANGAAWTAGNAVFEYPNDQRATTLWYHDHTLGMTRLNVYAGPAGFYILRGGPDNLVLDSKSGKPATLPGPAPALGDLPGTKYYEIPLAIQDRSFNSDGSLFFPDSRVFFDEFEGPYIPDMDSDISPIWNPEFFGNTMLVNGNTWPYLEVEPRRYRFRLLNGCNSRFLILKFDNDIPFTQIGTEGGFLPAPIQLSEILLGLAERADVIVDFSQVPVGTQFTLVNLGPDEPFGGGIPGSDFPVSDSATTGRVMQFRVVAAKGKDTSTPVDRLVLPTLTPLGPADNTRKVSLNEDMSMVLEDVGPRAALLGTVSDLGEGVPLEWMDQITENPAVGATEVWEIHNFTEDAHPIHVHLVQFQVVNRETFNNGSPGVVRPPESWETGFKDTVIAYPEEITRIKAKFDTAGQFVWHCHIVDHEDNEMMRPYKVGP